MKIDTPNKCDFKQYCKDKIVAKTSRSFVCIDTPNKCDFRLDKFGAKTSKSLVGELILQRNVILNKTVMTN